ncbi:hypothetical protein A3J13_01285 [Candidatus Daviesbacteria bacterium RIFCSPLOWO2_02_FULL_36_8]|uniref:HAD family hydrolase n=1 Tax=Candidatus Daviesbacteria bacterium RIFCSPLOWO2_02_FULL_36_8 TaxID=1797793 RepID=A0A1F5MGY1_9BACT|nr:MAG: hypothetical protein A3J13_01285 [Candidatus Daviesbacteria bacterium RIFCSPLOWO2_02_FULL_36_8]
MIEAVVFDYTNTISEMETGNLYPEVLNVLEELVGRGIRLGLVSRASNAKDRLSEFNNLDLGRYFEVIDVVLVGNNKNFDEILKKLDVKPKETIIVGDRVKSEILEGNRIGARTVWIRRGRFATEEPETDLEQPDYRIDSLVQLLEIVDKLS